MRARVGSSLPSLWMLRVAALWACCSVLFWCACTGTATPGAADNSDGNPSGNPDEVNDNSVGGVVVGGDVFGPPTGGGNPSLDLLRARIRNESAARADVTVRFIEQDEIVHLAFIRALPATITTVTSPEMSAEIEISGIDDSGRVLTNLNYQLGVDYDKYRPAEYIIGAATGDGGPVDPLPDDEPGRPLPVGITLTAPAADQEVVLGSTLRVAWEDKGGAEGAVVRLFLGTSVASTTRAALGPAVGASLDGLNDELEVVVQGVEPGEYLLFGEISDGFTSDASVAPGRVKVVPSPANIAPTIILRRPSQTVEVDLGGLLMVEWSDDDPDDNATITFALESSAGASLGRFPIGPPVAEDPDGPSADQASLPIAQVLPGIYDLVASIDDGELTGTARMAQAVRVRPAAGNDTPALQLLDPATDSSVPLDGSFVVRWVDTDANDNARISLLLDPDPSVLSLDGDEVLLIDSLSEDPDGAGDSVTLGIPAGTLAGLYRVLGVITDGQAEVVAAAPGLLTLTEVEPNRDPGGPRPLRSIQVIQPSVDVRLRLGDSFLFRVEYSNLPASASPKVFLSGISKDGQGLRVEITPPDAQPNTDLLVTLAGAAEGIPNKWWPRQFRLEAEVTIDGVRYIDAADGTLWLRQEVEILSAQMINYWCWDENLADLESTDFFGLEIQWYGGGFEGIGDDIGRAAASPVRFWATFDGAVPDDIKGDSRHRMMKQLPESPNVVRTTRIDYATMIGLGNVSGGSGPLPIEADLESGVYRIVAAAETQAFGRVLSAPVGPVEMCFPIPASSKPPEP